MKIKVNSEIGKLKAAMLHPPGKEITRLTPPNMKALLWDNIPWPERALEEHQNYVKQLEERGAKVYLTPDLLKDVIKDKVLRNELIEKSAAYEAERLTPETLQAMQEYMKGVNDDQLIDIFMGGITKQELYQETHEVAFEDLADHANEFCLTPMTNIGWSRDPAASIGNGIAFSHMYGRAREREPLYVKYVFKYHPEFKDLDYHVWYGISDDDQTNLEGGNVFPLSKNVLAIGFNERTGFRTIMKLAARLMEKSEITDVLALQFDNKKLVEGDVGMFVHVDTFFTMVDHESFLFFPHIAEMLTVYRLTKGEGGKIKTYVEGDLFETLKKVLHLKSLNLIEVGGGDSYRAQAEQWGLAANVFTIAPGVVFAYNRNTSTNKELRKNGIEVIELEGNELAKVLGGPRCATMPLWREDL